VTQGYRAAKGEAGGLATIRKPDDGSEWQLSSGSVEEAVCAGSTSPQI